MRCEACMGYGTIPSWTIDGGWQPCPNCVGGQTNCCDGLCEQPDDNKIIENNGTARTA